MYYSSEVVCDGSTLYSLFDRAIRSPFLERSCGFNGCFCSFKLPQYWFNSYWPPILLNFMRLPSFFMMALASHKCNFLILNQILNAILPNQNFVTLRNFSISESLIKKNKQTWQNDKDLLNTLQRSEKTNTIISMAINVLPRK